MRNVLIAGNWKMNGSPESVVELVEGIKNGNASDAQIAIFPPAIFLMEVGRILGNSDVLLGAQNVCDHANGAYTGEISAQMLLDAGCWYALVGHSERRSLYQESNDLVAARFEMAISAGIVPILCVGETLAQREAGVTEEIIAEQIEAISNTQGYEVFEKSVIAYEPVWAIGTGKVASPQQAQDVHHFIRGKISAHSETTGEKVQILYGGSMNPRNAVELLAQEDIDGGLIGGASLKAEDFLAIAQSV
ncbi:MAG: triosephosphate isomerase [Gammaproteobacteria bacterium]|jgi:triosephosphate isomerase